MQSTQKLQHDGTTSTVTSPNGNVRGLNEARLGDIVEVIWSDAWEDHDLDEDPTNWPGEKEIRSVGVLRRVFPVVSITEDTASVDGVYQRVTHVPYPYIKQVVKHGRPLGT